MREVWRDIAGYEGQYQVSNIGRVRTLDRIVNSKPGLKQKLKSMIRKLREKKGYMTIGLSKYKKYTYPFVHRLVAFAFIPNPDNKPYINHIDHNPLNNRVENLEWCTPYENRHHSINAGRARYRSAESNRMSKIKNRQISQIFRHRERGLSQSEIAKRYGVHQSCISFILSRKTYKSVSI